MQYSSNGASVSSRSWRYASYTSYTSHSSQQRLTLPRPTQDELRDAYDSMSLHRAGAPTRSEARIFLAKCCENASTLLSARVCLACRLFEPLDREVCVDLRRGEALVTQQLLDASEVRAARQ